MVCETFRNSLRGQAKINPSSSGLASHCSLRGVRSSKAMLSNTSACSSFRADHIYSLTSPIVCLSSDFVEKVAKLASSPGAPALAKDVASVLVKTGKHRISRILSSLDDDGNGELDIYEFLSGLKILGVKGATRAKGQELFDHMAEADDEDEEEDLDIVIQELLHGCAEHKWRVENMPSAEDLSHLCTGAKASSMKSGSSAADCGPTSQVTRQVRQLQQIIADIDRVQEFVGGLRQLCAQGRRRDPSTYGSTLTVSATRWIEIQRMRSNLHCMLATRLRRRLGEYVKVLTPLPQALDRAKELMRKVSQVLTSLESNLMDQTDQPYGLPVWSPAGPNQGVRAACRSRVLTQLRSVHAPFRAARRVAGDFSADLAQSIFRQSQPNSYHNGLSEFKILVVDQPASLMLAHCCGIFDIIDAGVCLIDDVRQRRSPYAHLEAVYIVAPTPHSINHICRDFASSAATVYKTAHVLLTGTPPSALLSKLVQSVGPLLGTVQELQLDFLPTDDHAFDLAIDTDHSYTLDELSSAPHIHHAVAEQISQVCVQLDISRPMVRWHDAAAAPDKNYCYRPTDTALQAADACSKIAELTYQKLLDKNVTKTTDDQEKRSTDKAVNDRQNTLRKAVGRRKQYINKERAAQRANAAARGTGGMSVFEGMDLDSLSAFRIFGIRYIERPGYVFELDLEQREMFKLDAREPRKANRNASTSPPPHERLHFKNRSTGELWLLKFDAKPLDWETAGSRDAGVHLCNFRLWRQDDGIVARQSQLQQLDDAIELAEMELWEAEQSRNESDDTIREKTSKYDRADAVDVHHYHHVMLGKRAASSRTIATSRMQPDATTGVLIVHRAIDIVAPLMHDCTYEAACADLLDEDILEQFPEHTLRSLAIRWNPVKTVASADSSSSVYIPRPMTTETTGWLDVLASALPQVAGLILSGLRTTAHWNRFRDQDVSKILHELSDDLHLGKEDDWGTAPRPPNDIAREFVNHRSLLTALQKAITSRGVAGLVEWERDLLTGKCNKSTARAANVTGVLWERNQDRAECDIPAFRRMLSKITNASDKARLALIFILMRWDKRQMEQPSRGDTWKMFVVHENKRVGHLYDAGLQEGALTELSTTGSYVNELSHVEDYTMHYKRSKFIEFLMLKGAVGIRTASNLRVDGRLLTPDWNGNGRVLSGGELEQLKSQAFLNVSNSPDLNGFVKDEHAALRYRRELDKKWALFEKNMSKEAEGRGNAFTIAGGDYAAHVNFDENWRRSSTKQYREDAKETMRGILSDPDGCSDNPIYQAMQQLYTTKQDGDMWTKMSQEKKVTEFAKFKKYELYFEAYYAWCTRGILPKDSILGDPWMQKLLRSLKVSLPTAFELANSCDGPCGERYGYRARSALNSNAGDRAADKIRGGLRTPTARQVTPKKGKHLQPTVYHVGRDFGIDRLSHKLFPLSKSLQMKLDASYPNRQTNTPEPVPLKKMVIFVVGGVTHWEVRAARVLAQDLKCDVYIGGTEVLSPERAMKLLRVAPGLEVPRKHKSTRSGRPRHVPSKGELDAAFDQCKPRGAARGSGRDQREALQRDQVEGAVALLGRKFRFRHRSSLSRAFKAAVKDIDGAIDRHEFRLVVENTLLIDTLLDEFSVQDGAGELRLSSREFSLGCIVAAEFGGDEISQAESEAAFRKLNIDGYVLFDELCEWVARRQRGESSLDLVTAPPPPPPPPLETSIDYSSEGSPVASFAGKAGNVDAKTGSQGGADLRSIRELSSVQVRPDVWASDSGERMPRRVARGSRAFYCCGSRPAETSGRSVG